MHFPGLNFIPAIDDALGRICNPPTPTLDKFARVAQDIRDAEAEEALEQRRLAQDDDAWERRAAAERGEE